MSKYFTTTALRSIGKIGAIRNIMKINRAIRALEAIDGEVCLAVQNARIELDDVREELADNFGITLTNEG